MFACNVFHVPPQKHVVQAFKATVHSKVKLKVKLGYIIVRSKA